MFPHAVFHLCYTEKAVIIFSHGTGKNSATANGETTPISHKLERADCRLETLFCQVVDLHNRQQEREKKIRAHMLQQGDLCMGTTLQPY